VRTVLCVGTYGPSDPTRATLPFATALCSVAAGDGAQVALMGDATLLMKDRIAEQVQGAGWRPLTELLKELVAHDVPIFV